ncbi:Two-component system response regulator QseB [Hyphomicrobium sulfonivorans]|uniref:Two-component system response regulator QseB n=1 Tax=Hyphomicrobium sulfonivorans TaxID=121290 RepID=A0A109BCF8_HYPSL|nr:response regulator transcription factor [Hyphomicrobium sulfonivorans]KWT66196.1 Two-component system response regulator QseB [Hyphomicrobium sulfonivorans]
MRLLIVEDDLVLRSGLSVGLGLHGFTAEAVETCADALAALSTTQFDAVVLDLMLPDGSGFDVLRDLRGRNDTTPVLLLTARDSVRDRIHGLDSGADDYLGKPFDLDELAARLRALRRRSLGRAKATIDWQGLELDPERRTVTTAADGEPLNLSRREFALLQALVERPGVVHSKPELEDILYGWQEEVESNAVEVHIHNLRAKIGKERIETVRGLGYRAKA